MSWSCMLELRVYVHVSSCFYMQITQKSQDLQVRLHTVEATNNFLQAESMPLSYAPLIQRWYLKKGTSVMNYWCLFNDCHFICVMVRSFRVVLALSQTRSRTRPGQRATERLRPEPAPEQRGTVTVEDGSHCPKLGERKTCTLYDFICCSSWSKRQKPLAKAR